MKTKNKLLSSFALSFGIIAAIVFSAPTRGGWLGAMNGLGYGWAGVKVSSYLLTTNGVTSTNMTGPSASISPTTGYSTNGNLPKGASAATVSRIKGSSGYVWEATTTAANGDKTDNPELESRVVIHGANCPTLMMESILTPGSFVGKNGSITVKTVGTAGTALWLRGFEVPPGTIVPADDPDTENNETTDFLKAQAVLKFENLMVGPFEYGFNGKCELIIYFNLDGDSLENLIFVSDGVAKANPIEITCPPPQTVTCGQSYAYPLPTWTGGCGNITFTYSPAVEHLVLGLNTVTVTAKDGNGDTSTCTFTVNVVDSTKPVPDLASLPTIKGQCSATVTAPTATDDCSGKITGTTTDPLTYNQQGTYTVHWKFTDAAGNTATQDQIVEVKDTIKPVIPVLPDVASSFCSAPVTLTRPTTTDNCAGIVTGTTSTVFPITALGTNIVSWTFTDGHNNTVTADQRVIISGLTFVGFYSPLNAVGGSCDKPAKSINAGSVVPIKFDMKCGSTFVITGTPPVIKVEPWSSGCVQGNVQLLVNATYQNDWHANWDTTAWAKGVYKIIVELPDGTKPFVFVNLK